MAETRADDLALPGNGQVDGGADDRTEGVEGLARVEGGEAQKTIDPQLQVSVARNLMYSMVEMLGDQVEYILRDPAVRASVYSDIQALLKSINEVDSMDQLNQFLENFLINLESKPLGEGVYQLIYRTRTLITNVQESVDSVSRGKEPAFLEACELTQGLRHFGSNVAQDVQKPSRLKSFGRGAVALGRKIVTSPKTAWTRRAEIIAWTYGMGKSEVAPGVGFAANRAIDNPEVAAALSTVWGIVAATYGIYMSFVLTSVEGKATRGAKAVEILSGLLVEYAEYAPETASIVKEILKNLRDGIEGEGNFARSSDLLLSLRRSTAPDASVRTGEDKMNDVREQLASLQESCRSGISETFIRRWGHAANLMAALSGGSVAESVVYSQGSLLAVEALQAVIKDYDKPYGKDGVVKLSTEPIMTALKHVDVIDERYKMEKKFFDKLEAEQAIDRSVVDSFYTDFMGLFEPWYENFGMAQNVAAQHIQTRLSTAQGSEAQMRVFEEAAKAKQSVLDRVPEPEFLLGNETVAQRVVNPRRQITFRHDDDLMRQLALIEMTKKKVNEDPNMPGEKAAKAKQLLDNWRGRVNLEKESRRNGKSKLKHKSVDAEVADAANAIVDEVVRNVSGEEKPVEQEVADAAGTITNELKLSVEDAERRKHVRYVFDRKQGSKHLESETANRATDWEGENIELKLTPIHRKVIDKLEIEARKVEGQGGDGADKAKVYRRLIGDINRVRVEQGLDELKPEQSQVREERDENEAPEGDSSS